MSLKSADSEIIGEVKVSLLDQVLGKQMIKLDKQLISYNDYDYETRKILKRHFGVLNHLVSIWPGAMTLPHSYKDIAYKIYRLPLRPSDVWVMSFPKAGSTWTQEMVWCIGNGCNLKKAKSLHMDVKFPLLEHWINSKGMVGKVVQKGWRAKSLFNMLKNNPEFLELAKNDTIATMKKTPTHQRRFTKTHILFSLLPPQMLDTCKIIYVARNPKDTVVSYFHHNLLFKQLYDFRGNFRDFVNLFMADLLPWCPYWENLRQAYQRRHHPNMCFILYEDMKQDLAGVVGRVATFLQEDLSAEQVKDLCEHLSFKSMGNNNKVNREVFRNVLMDHNKNQRKFIRKGEVGDWKNYFDADLDREFSSWIDRNSHGIDIQFRYE